MLLIPCPYCGMRSETEFRCHGEVRPPRDALANTSDQEWLDYLYVQSKRSGMMEEFWSHEKGCGEWFRLRRDIETHELRAPRDSFRDD